MTNEQRDRVDAALLSDDWEEHEKLALRWAWRLLGHFQMALWEAITLADVANLDQLELAFPMDVRGWLAYQRYGLADRLREAGLLI